MKRNYLLIFFFSYSIIISPQQSNLSRSVNYLSGYIASDKFASYKLELSHLTLIDSIYITALEYNNNDISETLLSITFAAIPYRQVPIVVPLLNISLNYPLVSSDDSTFILKNKNLPSEILFDSPLSEYGDKDKIAHFFGNAFIGYHSTFFDISNIMGLFVEVFEKSFQVQAHIDERDLLVNFYGRAFGKALKQNRFVLPSQSLIFHTLFYSFIQI